MYKMEIIGFNLQSCLNAQTGGADRIELCDSPPEGGTTPSFGFIKAAREQLSIDLFVMIRPRGGDFLYSKEEFEIMKNDVLICKQLGCEGIVTGILTKEGKIDVDRNKELVDLASPLKATFHRAFDRVSDPVAALEALIEIGFERVLTSGCVPKAMEGAQLLASLVKQSAGRIIIMPGSGVNAENLTSLAHITGATEFHSSATIPLESGMEFKNEDMNENLSTVLADTNSVTEMVARLKALSTTDKSIQE